VETPASKTKSVRGPKKCLVEGELARMVFLCFKHLAYTDDQKK